MATVFPDGIDIFKKHYDPSPDDLKKIYRYEGLRSKDKTLEEQREFVELAGFVRKFVFTSEDLNTIQDAMVNLQTFFKEKTETKINEWQTTAEEQVEQKREEFRQNVQELNEQINTQVGNKKKEIEETSNSAKQKAIREIEQHKAEFIYLGQYDNGATYKKDNLVNFNKNIFRCKKDNITGIPPLSSTPNFSENWEVVIESIKGDKGDAGANLKFKGKWQENVGYDDDDLVVYHNKMFISKNQHIGKSFFDMDDWILVSNSDSLDLEEIAIALNCVYFLKKDNNDIVEIIGNISDFDIQTQDLREGRMAIITKTTRITENFGGVDNQTRVSEIYTDSQDILGKNPMFEIVTLILPNGKIVTLNNEGGII